MAGCAGYCLLGRHRLRGALLLARDAIESTASNSHDIRRITSARMGACRRHVSIAAGESCDVAQTHDDDVFFFSRPPAGMEGQRAASQPSQRGVKLGRMDSPLMVGCVISDMLLGGGEEAARVENGALGSGITSVAVIREEEKGKGLEEIANVEGSMDAAECRGDGGGNFFQRAGA